MRSSRTFFETTLFLLANVFYFASPWQRFFDSESKDGYIIFIGLIWGGIVLAYLILEKEAKMNRVFISNFLFVFLLLVISSLWSYDQEQAFSGIRKMIFFFSFIICSVVSVKTKNDFDTLLFWHLNGIVILDLLLLINVDPSIIRLSAFSLDPNGIAVINLIGIAIIFFYASQKNQSGFKVFFLLITLGLLSYALFLTGSRGGFITLLALSFLFLFTLIGKQPKKLLFAVYLLILLVATFSSIPEEHYQRLLGVTNISTFDLAGRDLIWGNILSVIQERPLSGVGYGGFLSYNNDKFGSYQIAHNTFLEILVESGILVFIALFSFFLIHIVRGFRSITKDYKMIYMLFIAILFFSSLSLSSLLNKETWQMISMILVIRHFNLGNHDEKLLHNYY